MPFVLADMIQVSIGSSLSSVDGHVYPSAYTSTAMEHKAEGVVANVGDGGVGVRTESGRHRSVITSFAPWFRLYFLDTRLELKQVV